jgi:hypothetical protein
MPATPLTRFAAVEAPVDDLKPGVVDEDVDPSEALDQSVGGLSDLCAVCDVKRLDGGSASKCLDLSGNPLKFVASASEEND